MENSMSLAFIVIISLLCGSACGTSHLFVRTAAPPRELLARSPSQVAIFMSSRPEHPYAEIGMIESQQQSLYSEDGAQAIIDKMRAYAGTRGCDALAIVSSNNATIASGSRGYTSSGTLMGYRGACLVYTASPTASQPVCRAHAAQHCIGESGCRGSQRCAASGAGYTLCECEAEVAAAPAGTLFSVQ
jgi:hypothetical protein